MDITAIIWSGLQQAWFLIPLGILAALSKSAWFKGVVGEGLVNISAKCLLNKEEYHLVKDVTLPTDDGTTQIDHIIVSKYGIFVVETKNMKGWIFGKPHQRMWTHYGGGYVRFIKSKKSVVLTDNEVETILFQIQEGRLKPSLKTSRDHVNHVKQVAKEKKNNPICSKCGSDMVERETSKGPNKGKKFLGCSAFPKCRSIQPIN